MIRNLFVFFLFINGLSQLPKARGQLQTFRCYVCFYDRDSPDIQGSDEDCIQNKFDGSDIRQVQGFRSCFISHYLEDGEVISVIRGGDQNAITDFSVKASRHTRSYITTFCKEDLCNSARTATGVFFLVTALVSLSQLQLKLF